jgi:hypothetical protein
MTIPLATLIATWPSHTARSPGSSASGETSTPRSCFLGLTPREGIDTSNATGRRVAAVLASSAELELELGRERRAAVREARRARGQAIGRPKAVDKSKAELARRMHASGEPARSADLRTDRFLSCLPEAPLAIPPRQTFRHLALLYQRKCRNLSSLLLSSYLPTTSLACGRLINR